MTGNAASRTRRRHVPRREQGAVMIVVMIVLLMVTATGIFAAHTTAYEVRSAGYAHQLMRTQYLGESGIGATLAWVDANQPQVLDYLLTDSLTRNTPVLDLGGFEPPLAPNRRAHRFYADDFNVLTQPGVDGSEWAPTDDPVRMGAVYDPVILVDVYDDYALDGGIPGYEEGGRNLIFLGVTLTARGRYRIPVATDRVEADVSDFLTDDVQPATERDISFQEHETASDARAFGVLGPVPR